MQIKRMRNKRSFDDGAGLSKILDIEYNHYLFVPAYPADSSRSMTRMFYMGVRRGVSGRSWTFYSAVKYDNGLCSLLMFKVGG